MPTVLRIGPYRFLFYSSDYDEPKHIHIKAGNSEAKFWLEPITLSWNRGFNNKQLNEIEKYVEDNLSFLLRKWTEFFGE
ncbi:MAG: DUF4160 domain-containing protein [Anaerolineae bacterium]|nr:DUF4160 domain-containing protein [Anaerolineae bacterium]